MNSGFVHVHTNWNLCDAASSEDKQIFCHSAQFAVYPQSPCACFKDVIVLGTLGIFLSLTAHVGTSDVFDLT